MKGVDIRTDIVINCPIEEVAGYASNPSNATQWYANIKSVEWLGNSVSDQSGNTIRVGARIAFTAKFLGKKLAYVYEIVEFIPRVRLVMRTADGPFPMETTYAWKKVSEGETLMKLRNSGSPSGFSIIFAPFLAMAMRRENQKDLERLKQLLEKKLLRGV